MSQPPTVSHSEQGAGSIGRQADPRGGNLEAQLSEPVVIDVIIRFSFERLNDKFMGFMALAPNIGSIGCPAELYLSILSLQDSPSPNDQTEITPHPSTTKPKPIC